MSFQDARRYFRGRLQTPELRSFVGADSDDPAGIGTDRHASATAAVSCQDARAGGRVGGLQVPGPGRIVPASGNKPATVGADRDATDVFLMPCQDARVGF